MRALKPFWRYYGGKNRASVLYPAPQHDTEMLIEPFAGAAGYSCRHWHKKVILIDRSPIIAGVWQYLINVGEYEVRCLPDIPDDGSVDDLPSWVPQEARWLIGFWCNSGSVYPGKTPAARARNDGQNARSWSGWGWKVRRRICTQLDQIRHWQVIQGEYHEAPDKKATWFIDPPYNNRAGRRYPHQVDSYSALADWCRSRKGMVMVCENSGADWLPFRELATIKAQEGKHGRRQSHEVIWTNHQRAMGYAGQVLFPWGAS